MKITTQIERKSRSQAPTGENQSAIRNPQSAIEESAILKIGIVTPAPPGSRHGNRVTALRWARMLRSLGHRVAITQNYEGESYELLVALHALRSHDAIKRFHCEHPESPLIVALTGTDLYRDLSRSEQAQQTLELSSQLIVLQPNPLSESPRRSSGSS